MANTTKITKVDFINFVLANYELPIEYVEKANEMKASLEKRSGRVDEKKIAENNGIKSTILETLGNVDKATVTELQKANSELGELSNQKISSLLSQLVKSGEVVKTIDKKVSYFSLA